MWSKKVRCQARPIAGRLLALALWNGTAVPCPVQGNAYAGLGDWDEADYYYGKALQLVSFSLTDK